MAKRLMCALMIWAALLAVAGCAAPDRSATESTPQQEEPIRMVHFIDVDGKKPYDHQVQQLFQKFTAQTGVPIEIKTLPWDQIDETLMVSSQSGEPLGDLFILSAQKLEYLVNGGALMPLDALFDASFDRASFLPLALSEGMSSFDGKLYMLPQAMHTRGLWYNKRYISDPPDTLSELVDAARRAMAEHPGITGFGFWGGSHYGAIEGTLSMLTWAYGGALSGESGRAAWANEPVANAVRFMSDCVNTYGISPPVCLTTADGMEVQEQFYNGKMAMILDGSFAYCRNEYSLDSVSEYGFAPMPGIDGPANNFANGWAWGIPMNTAHPDRAWAFIKWFMGKEVQIEHAEIEGSLPIRLDALADSQYKNAGFAPQFIKNLTEHGRPMDMFVYYQDAMAAMSGAAWGYCMDQEIDLEAALRKAQVDFNRKYYGE